MIITEKSGNYKIKFCDCRHINDTYLYEVTRSPEELPFTVLLEDFSKYGHRQFFCDIFVSREWDKGREIFKSSDVEFCFWLWDYLGLNEQFGPFTPSQINNSLSLNPPKVYRKTIYEVFAKMNKSFK